MSIKYQLITTGNKKNDKVKRIMEFLTGASKLVESNITSAIDHMNNQKYSLDSVKAFLKEFNSSVDSIIITECIKKSNKAELSMLREKRNQKDIHIQNCITLSKNMSISEDVLKFIILHDICSCDAVNLISKKTTKHIKSQYGDVNHATASGYLCHILLSDTIDDCSLYSDMVAHHQSKKGGIIYLVDKVEKIQTKNIARKMKVKEKDKLIEVYKDKCFDIIKKNEWYSISSFVELKLCKIIEDDGEFYKVTRVGKTIFVHISDSDGNVSSDNIKEIDKLKFDTKKKAKSYFKKMNMIL